MVQVTHVITLTSINEIEKLIAWQLWLYYLRIENKHWIWLDAFLTTENPVIATVDGSDTDHSKQFTGNRSPLQSTHCNAVLL